MRPISPPNKQRSAVTRSDLQASFLLSDLLFNDVSLWSGSLSESGGEVFRMLFDGDLGIDQAQRILSALGQQTDLVEFDDLVKRLEVLERDG